MFVGSRATELGGWVIVGFMVGGDSWMQAGGVMVRVLEAREGEMVGIDATTATNGSEVGGLKDETS